MTKTKSGLEAQNERMAAKLIYFNTAPAALQEKLALDAEFWSGAEASLPLSVPHVSPEKTFIAPLSALSAV